MNQMSESLNQVPPKALSFYYVRKEIQASPACFNVSSHLVSLLTL